MKKYQRATRFTPTQRLALIVEFHGWLLANCDFLKAGAQLGDSYKQIGEIAGDLYVAIAANRIINLKNKLLLEVIDGIRYLRVREGSKALPKKHPIRKFIVV